MQKFKRKKEERKKVVHATKSYYQKGKEKLKIERKKTHIRKLSCPTQYLNNLHKL